MIQPVYTNVQQMSFGQDKMFRIAFADKVGTSNGTDTEVEVRALLLMTPEVFQGLWKAMGGLIDNYEAKVGQIGDGRIVVPRLKV